MGRAICRGPRSPSPSRRYARFATTQIDGAIRLSRSRRRHQGRARLPIANVRRSTMEQTAPSAGLDDRSKRCDPHRRRTPDECGRSAAQDPLQSVIRDPKQNLNVCPTGKGRAGDFSRCGSVDFPPAFSPGKVLTRLRGEAYIRLLRCAAARRDGAPSKLLTDQSDPRPISVGGSELRRLSCVPGWGSPRSPGCLTGESEERETWTAESLRAASSKERVRPDETSAVHVLGQACRLLPARVVAGVTDLVKT